MSPFPSAPFTDVADGTFELRHFVIRSTPAREFFRSSAFFSFPRATPQLRDRPTQPTNHPSWMAMGIGPPQTTFKQTNNYKVVNNNQNENNLKNINLYGPLLRGFVRVRFAGTHFHVHVL
jgi:hypothetical protein